MEEQDKNNRHVFIVIDLLLLLTTFGPIEKEGKKSLLTVTIAVFLILAQRFSQLKIHFLPKCYTHTHTHTHCPQITRGIKMKEKNNKSPRQ